MSNPEYVTSEQYESNKKFLEDLKETGGRRIQRKSKQARITHDVTIISCILLAISGLFVFIPALAQAVGNDVVFVARMAHRVLGVVFVVVPLVSAVLAPKGVAHIFKNLFTGWDSDDKEVDGAVHAVSVHGEAPACPIRARLSPASVSPTACCSSPAPSWASPASCCARHHGVRSSRATCTRSSCCCTISGSS